MFIEVNRNEFIPRFLEANDRFKFQKTSETFPTNVLRLLFVINTILNSMWTIIYLESNRFLK